MRTARALPPFAVLAAGCAMAMFVAAHALRQATQAIDDGARDLARFGALVRAEVRAVSPAPPPSFPSSLPAAHLETDPLGRAVVYRSNLTRETAHSGHRDRR